MSSFLRPLFVAGFVVLVALADPRSASAQATTSTPDKTSMGDARYVIPKGKITLGANQATVKLDITWGKVLATGDGPQLGSSFIANPNVGNWTGMFVPGDKGQKYWVKAVLTWHDAAGNHVNAAVRGEVTLDP